MPFVTDDADELKATMREGRHSIEHECRAEFTAARDALTDEQLDSAAVGGSLPADAHDGRKTAAAVLALFMLAGFRTTATIEGQVRPSLAFDQSGYRVAGWMQATKARISDALARTQTAATRVMVADGLARGATGEQMRAAIRQSIGITERQAGALVAYRKALGKVGTIAQPGSVAELSDGIASVIADKRAGKEALARALRDKGNAAEVRAAIEAKKPLDPALIDRLVSTMAEGQLGFRAAAIGQIEATPAVNQGATEAWDQAADAGAVPPTGANRGNMQGAVEETWQTAQDERVRHSHEQLQGEARPASGAWQGASGSLRFPGDPEAPIGETAGCRCFIRRTATIPDAE